MRKGERRTVADGLEFRLCFRIGATAAFWAASAVRPTRRSEAQPSRFKSMIIILFHCITSRPLRTHERLRNTHTPYNSRNTHTAYNSRGTHAHARRRSRVAHVPLIPVEAYQRRRTVLYYRTANAELVRVVIDRVRYGPLVYRSFRAAQTTLILNYSVNNNISFSRFAIIIDRQYNIVLSTNLSVLRNVFCVLLFDFFYFFI